jgi:hypothetical protein
VTNPMSTPSTYSRTILSCVPITPEMAYLLKVCRSWPLVPEVLEQFQGTPEWDEARAWGWIMQTGRLTGMGARHAGPLPKGIVHDGTRGGVSSFPPCRSPTFQCQFHPRNLASTVSRLCCSSSVSPSPVGSCSSRCSAVEPGSLGRPGRPLTTSRLTPDAVLVPVQPMRVGLQNREGRLNEV